MSWQGYQRHGPIQSLPALEHWYDDQSAGSEALGLYGELYVNGNKQCHVVFDIEMSANRWR